MPELFAVLATLVTMCRSGTRRRADEERAGKQRVAERGQRAL